MTAPSLFTQVPEIDVQGVPFVVEADDERLFMGSFFTAVSSLCPIDPTIFEEHTFGSTLMPLYEFI